MAKLSDRLDIDIWEVIAAASSKPYGFMPFYPGPGLGGHCIPVDPFYLSWKAREFDFAPRFIELAGEINDQMPEYVVNKVARLLNKEGKCLNGSRILVLGVAYKKDIDDVRESPAIPIISSLLEQSADVVYHDPFVPSVKIGEQILHNTELTDRQLSSADCVLILTEHSAYDLAAIADRASLVYDTRNAIKRRDLDNVHHL
jgi:UDP-N-acetyl-D-glucosamine dehydrogenase